MTHINANAVVFSHSKKQSFSSIGSMSSSLTSQSLVHTPERGFFSSCNTTTIHRHHYHRRRCRCYSCSYHVLYLMKAKKKTYGEYHAVSTTDNIYQLRPPWSLSVRLLTRVWANIGLMKSTVINTESLINEEKNKLLKRFRNTWFYFVT